MRQVPAHTLPLSVGRWLKQRPQEGVNTTMEERGVGQAGTYQKQVRGQGRSQVCKEQCPVLRCPQLWGLTQKMSLEPDPGLVSQTPRYCLALPCSASAGFQVAARIQQVSPQTGVTSAQCQDKPLPLTEHFCALSALPWGLTVWRKHVGGRRSGDEDMVRNRDPVDHENSQGPRRSQSPPRLPPTPGRSHCQPLQGCWT